MNIHIILNNFFSFSAKWIPKRGGTYRIECYLDGFQLAQSYLVEVFLKTELHGFTLTFGVKYFDLQIILQKHAV